jgi:predicted MFS family arabinose efflux permease
VLDRPLVGEYRWTTRVVVQLAVLATAAYVYAVAELVPIGAMPAIASDLHVSEAHVGMLPAAYAFISVLATVPLVRWTARWPRRRAFVMTLACLTVSQVFSALAPGLGLLAASRVLCALTHGLMWSIIATIGARLVPASHTGRATTALYIGTSAALIVGNPLTTSMSQAWGWRVTTLVIAAAAAVITVLAQCCLPVMAADAARPETDSPGRWFRNARLVVLCGITLVGVTAHFVAYTFVVPIIRDAAGLGDRGQAMVLAAYGVVGLVSMALLAPATDSRPRLAATTTLAVLCLAFWVLVAGGPVGSGVTAILVWGGCAAVLPPLLQASAIRACPQHAEYASALYVTAFQIGIVSGSLLGGLAYGGHQILPVVATSAVLFAVALVGTLFGGGVFRASSGPGLRQDRTDGTVAEQV